jgi:hypothetical protein
MSAAKFNIYDNLVLFQNFYDSSSLSSKYSFLFSSPLPENLTDDTWSLTNTQQNQ